MHVSFPSTLRNFFSYFTLPPENVIEQLFPLVAALLRKASTDKLQNVKSPNRYLLHTQQKFELYLQPEA